METRLCRTYFLHTDQNAMSKSTCVDPSEWHAYALLKDLNKIFLKKYTLNTIISVLQHIAYKAYVADSSH